MARVELRHVWKRFGDFVAVEDFSLNAADGEFIVFVGPSGCGKTTTMRIIAGLEVASDGEVQFDGKDVTDELPHDRDVAMVFQNYALFPHLNVFSNMAFGMRLRKVPKSEIEERVRKTAQLLGIEGGAAAAAEGIVGRPAATRGARPRDRARAARLPDGRAALQSRRRPAHGDARRNHQAAGAARRDDLLRDA